jgi:eukaryotic-like serine/threonine-protein kinase
MRERGVPGQVYAFGEFEVEPQLGQLRHRGQPVELAARSFALLHYLIEQRERAVSKHELLDVLWRGVAVAEGNLYTQMNLVRRALRQRPNDRAPIRTEHGRGYRFFASVQVLQRPATALPSAAPESADMPLLGRGEVMDQLRLALHAAAAGRGQFRMLSGEAGIGKTRVATELGSSALASDASVWVGRCRADEDAPAFWPWVELLRGAMADLPNAPLRALYRVTPPELAALLPELQDYAEDEPAEPLHARARLSFFAAVQQLFVRAARAKPRVLILEDLHWADASTAKLLLHVASDIPLHRLLIIGTRRDTDQRERAAQQALSAALALPHCRELPLGGLKRDDVMACIASLARAQPSRRLCEVVHRKTAGNPLLIQSAVQTLVREHGAEVVSGWQGSDLHWSDMARDPVRERVAQLDPATRALLDLAAVIGARFELPLLSAASGAAMPAVLAGLAVARAQGLLHQSREAPWRFEFNHELTRDTVYDDLTPQARVSLHLGVAEALETRVPLSSADIRALAFHYRQALPAGKQDKAAAYAQRAASGAARATAFEDAAMLYRWALEAMDAGADAPYLVRIRVLHELGRAQRDAGQSAEARVAFERALELARKHGDAEQFARSALWLRVCVPLLTPPAPGVERRLDQALQMLGDQNASLRAALLAWLARNRALGVDHKRAMLAEARATAGLEPYTSFAIAESTIALEAGPDALPVYLQACDEMQALGAKYDAPFWSWQAHLSRTRALLTLGDIAACDREIQACERLHGAVGSSYMAWWTKILQLQRAIGDGRFDDARAGEAALGSEVSRNAPHVNFQYLLRLQRLEHARAKGELASAADQVERFAEDFSFIGNHQFWRALLFTAQGDRPRAQEALDRIATWMRGEHRRGENFLYYLCSIAEMCVAAQDTRLGAVSYDALLPYARLNACNGVAYLGSVAHYLAILAVLLSRFDDAATHFEAAAAFNRQLGALPALGRTRAACQHASSLAPGEPSRARLRALAETIR